MSDNHVLGDNHETLHDIHFYVDSNPIGGQLPEMLWTENETSDHTHPHAKDAFHKYDNQAFCLYLYSCQVCM